MSPFETGAHGPPVESPFGIYADGRAVDAAWTLEFLARERAEMMGRAGRLDLNQSLGVATKMPLSKSANRPNMAAVANSRKEVIQCLIVISPV